MSRDEVWINRPEVHMDPDLDLAGPKIFTVSFSDRILVNCLQDPDQNNSVQSLFQIEVPSY